MLQLITRHPSPLEKPQPIAKDSQVTVTIKQQKSEFPLKHRIHLGKKQANAELQQIIADSKVGQICLVKTKEGKNFEVEVKEVHHPTQKVLTYFEECQVLKAEGNASIKSKDNSQALAKYEAAYKKLEFTVIAKEVQLRLSLISNMALATLNLQNYSECIKWCNLHLQEAIDPHIKMVYRLACAYKGVKDWQEATKTIDFGMKISLKDEKALSDFKQLQSILQKEQKQQKQKQKAVYGKMFS